MATPLRPLAERAPPRVLSELERLGPCAAGGLAAGAAAGGALLPWAARGA